MASKQELLDKIDSIRPLEKSCDSNFSYRSHIITTSVYKAFIDGKIDLSDRAKLITQIRDMTTSFSNHCKCMQ
jgi:hypothetical protein